jgi:4-hydroxybenzoyl-CoA reductase subunit beta
MDALPLFDLVRPRTLSELIAARAAHPDSRLLGGGTDLMVNIRRGIVAPPLLIDINTVTELRGISADADALEIGAAVTLSELATHPDVAQHYPVVAQAAGHIAGPTHRNMGTVGGNIALDTRCIFYNQSEWWREANHHCLKTTGQICHVAPKSRGVCFATFSGDLAPALLTLDAEIDIAGPAGWRTMPLAELYIGYAVAGVAVALRRDGDTLADLRVAITGTNPRPVRLAGTAELCGGALDARVFAGLDALVRDQIMAMKTTFTPGHYRRRVAGVLARRLVQRLFEN